MQNKATCPSCQKEMLLLEPKPPKEPDVRFLSESGELFPLLLNNKPRWVVRCPGCKKEAVALKYLESQVTNTRIFGLIDYPRYREQRERALRELRGEHLAQVASAAILPAWISSAVLSIGWGFWTHDFTFLALTCISPFLIFLLMGLVYKIPQSERISGELIAPLLSVGWLIVSALVGSRVEFAVAAGVLVLWWIVFFWGVPEKVSRDALIAVEQEMLQLRWLPVASADSPAPEPYRQEGA